jgi:predicted nuclease of predicted toxin-antitoxin system
MKLLLDANISWRLTNKLKEHFTECLHVDYIGLSYPPKDIDIWNFAKENELVIISNDTDFLNLLNQKGFPPKIVLLKTGNQSNQYIESLLIKHSFDILDLVNGDGCGFLEIF